MDAGAQFRRRLNELVLRRYRSLDRFYLECDFSKGHLSNILRGKVSPSVATLLKLAKALDVELVDFFTFPEHRPRHRAIELLGAVSPDTIRRVIRLLGDEAKVQR